jgi:hypothetical protein
LRGYTLALADVERRGGKPSETSLDAAREAGVITADGAGTRQTRSFFARLFGGGKDADEVNEDPAPKNARAATAVASVSPSKAKTVSVEQIVPLPAARPNTIAVATAEPKPASIIAAMTVKPASQSFVTASLGANLFDNRGYWRGAIQDGPDLPTAVTASTKYETASLDPSSTGTTALAYAATSEIPKPAQARPMGVRSPRQPAEASVMPAQGNTTVAEKPATAPAAARQPVDSPWLRAAMLTPSFSTYMSATRLGTVDMRPLQELLYKPSQSLAMSFSTDPHLGMVTGRFNGPAVVFLATTTFTTQSTAAFAMHTTALR